MVGKTEVPAPGKEDVSPGKTNPPDTNVDEKDTIPAAAPLRRPYSPAVKVPPRREDDVPELTGSQNQNNNKQQGGRNFNHGPRNFNNNNKQDNRQDNRQGNKPQRDRRPRQDPEEDEDWGSKYTKPPAPITTQPAPKAPVAAPKAPVAAPKAPVAAPKAPVAAPKAPVAAPKAPTAAPKVEAAPPAAAPRVAVKAPGSVGDATPGKGGKKLVPKNYLIELLSPGDSVLLSVEGEAPGGGLVCLSMHERYEAQYQELCEQYTVDCDADTTIVTPSPGDTFSILDADGGYYRARCLSTSQAALLDAGRMLPLCGAVAKPLGAKYEGAPEFCCVLMKSGAKVGDNLKCNLVTKTSDGYKVTLEDVGSGKDAGGGEVTRWMPPVEYPVVKTPGNAEAPVKTAVGIAAAGKTPAANAVAVVPNAAPPIPEVPRPGLNHNSRVVLVDASGADRAVVRPHQTQSQRAFDQILEDVVMYAATASPLKEPPVKGQVVIGKFTDGLFYRALCKRTNVKQNKYLLEYIEFGNIEIAPLETIYPCPPNLDLSSRPTEASLACLADTSAAFTPPAEHYLDKLKDDVTELVLTLPSGAETAASGSAVVLTEAGSGECVNRRLRELCTPDWRRLQDQGVDVVEMKQLMFSELESLELPPGPCTLDVLEVSALAAGSVSGCERGLAHQDRVLVTLAKQMEEYCNSELGRQPYLPSHEELCIAQCPPYPQWYRAVLLEQSPGSAKARVLYVDYGNVEEVPVTLLRKMLPEFVRGLPQLASHLEIKDFPENPTPEMLARAIEHMNINEQGRGSLAVTRCERQHSGLYLVHAPALLHAMLG